MVEVDRELEGKVRAAPVSIHHRVMRGEAILTGAEVIAALVASGDRPRRQPAAWVANCKQLLTDGNTLTS